MLNSLFSLITFTLVAFVASDSVAKPNQAKLADILSKAVDEELLKSGTPSLQVAIGNNGRVIFRSTKGLADIENNVLSTDQSKYRIGSVSKWFTSAATAALVEKGALDLDVSVQKYCSQFPKKKWNITSRDLLTHKSGIRHYLDYEEELNNTKSNSERQKVLEKRDREHISSVTRYIDVIKPLDSFAADPLIFEPQTDWLYSSLGYRVLACVLEGAAKSSYSDLVNKLVFEKAGMADTLKDDAWEIIPNRTTGYRLDRQKNIRRADLRDVSENLPAGGHLSTASDLVLFALNLNSSVFSSTERWPADSIPKTIGIESSWKNAIPSKELYGSGEMFFPDDSRLWVGHTGRIAGGAAIVVLQPQSDVSIAVLTNAKGWNGYISFVNRLKSILDESSDLLK